MAKKSFSNNMPAEMFISDGQPEQPAAERTTESLYEKRPSTARTSEQQYKPNYAVIEKRSARAQLLLQASLRNRLIDAAQEEGTSFNDFVHGILERAIDEWEKEHNGK